MTRAFDTYHFNSFSVPIPGLGGGTFHDLAQPNLLGFGEDAPEYPLLLGSYCRQLQAHLRAKGWLDKAFVYWFDEPSEDQFPFLQRGFSKLKRYCPDIRRMITKEVEPGLIGGPNLWCPISNAFNPERAGQRQKLGERFWWYVCTGPKAPYTGLFLDHAAPELRIWLWQTFQRGINGILVWECNYWTSDTAYPEPDHPQNPYADPMSWTSGYGTPTGEKHPWGNGDGRFIYPPRAAAPGQTAAPVLDGPVDSIRWEQLRDGIEDYEYLTILKRLLEQRGNNLDAEALQNYEALLVVPDTITRSMTDFTPDGAPIELRREQIARAIEALSPS
jgi:Glycoside hydrolase 123, catalytic domain